MVVSFSCCLCVCCCCSCATCVVSKSEWEKKNIVYEVDNTGRIHWWAADYYVCVSTLHHKRPICTLQCRDIYLKCSRLSFISLCLTALLWVMAFPILGGSRHNRKGIPNLSLVEMEFFRNHPQGRSSSIITINFCKSPVHVVIIPGDFQRKFLHLPLTDSNLA